MYLCPRCKLGARNNTTEVPLPNNPAFKVTVVRGSDHIQKHDHKRFVTVHVKYDCGTTMLMDRIGPVYKNIRFKGDCKRGLKD